MGFGAFRRGQRRDRIPWVCLTHACRPQGFSPSRRCDLPDASWPCFMPLPSLGFLPSELFPLSPAGLSLDTRCSLVVRPPEKAPTSELFSDGASVTPVAGFHDDEGRCSPGLLLPEACWIPCAGQKPTPLALFVMGRLSPALHAAPQGTTHSPGTDSLEPIQPPRGFPPLPSGVTWVLPQPGSVGKGQVVMVSTAAVTRRLRSCSRDRHACKARRLRSLRTHARAT